jgi:AAA ATPase containing von Willebrand factor type A (vWA) domain
MAEDVGAEIEDDPGGTSADTEEEIAETPEETEDDADGQDSDVSEDGDGGREDEDGSSEEKEKDDKTDELLSNLTDLSNVEDEELDKKLKVDNVNFSDLKKKYPDLTKDFPGIRRALFREKEFTQVFGTPEEAKEATGKLELFDQVDASLTAGDPSTLVQALADTTAKDFAKNIIPTLFKRSPELADAALRGPVLNILRRAVQKGRSLGDTPQGKNLVNAARILNHMLFDSYDIAEHDDVVIDGKIKEERGKLQQREQEIFQQRHDELEEAVTDVCYRKLESTIYSSLEGKGNEKLTKLMKQYIVENTIKKLGQELESDEQHNAVMRSLWKRAGKDHFSRSHLSQIATAYLGRARNLIGPIRNRLRSEALGNGKSVSGNGRKVVTSPRVGSGGTRSSGSGGKVDTRKVDWSKTSTEQALAGNYTFKK